MIYYLIIYEHICVLFQITLSRYNIYFEPDFENHNDNIVINLRAN